MELVFLLALAAFAFGSSKPKTSAGAPGSPGAPAVAATAVSDLTPSKPEQADVTPLGRPRVGRFDFVREDDGITPPTLTIPAGPPIVDHAPRTDGPLGRRFLVDDDGTVGGEPPPSKPLPAFTDIGQVANVRKSDDIEIASAAIGKKLLSQVPIVGTAFGMLGLSFGGPTGNAAGLSPQEVKYAQNKDGSWNTAKLLQVEGRDGSKMLGDPRLGTDRIVGGSAGRLVPQASFAPTENAGPNLAPSLED